MVVTRDKSTYNTPPEVSTCGMFAQLSTFTFVRQNGGTWILGGKAWQGIMSGGLPSD